ncbi:uncharacterized protein CC84DRAFT_764706 [Paraphaeosphaeria sporulosa]|uniref:Mid2 domain-containing protein n=1 Tax=Paraphaeosphaeria sporulosa TaxID=1460663 RepID=A0A177CGG1_9PLEO|nr:uncharacterized protein CC84DRAFT_764706 [Paraphaeosphaeria sporulosa]OAG06446.1 hypothetical protein CC84DRAFT_764706 [Paraphaeosphaeria sporulosa]
MARSISELTLGPAIAWSMTASTTIASNDVFSSTSNQPGGTTIHVSTTVFVTLAPSPTPSSTKIIVAPTLPPQSVDQTSVFPESFNTTNTARTAPSTSPSSSSPSSPSSSFPPSLVSSPGFTPPTAYKPASEFIIGVSVGGTVFLCAIVLITIILIRKRRNRIVRKKEEAQQFEVQPQPQLPVVDLDTKPAVPELESPREVRSYELPSPVLEVGRSEGRKIGREDEGWGSRC